MRLTRDLALQSRDLGICVMNDIVHLLAQVSVFLSESLDEILLVKSVGAVSPDPPTWSWTVLHTLPEPFDMTRRRELDQHTP